MPLLCAAFLLVPCAGIGQVVPESTEQSVAFRVVDAVTGMPLSGVSVRSRAAGFGGVTDSDGRIAVPASEGEALIVEFEKDGYQGSVGVLQVEEATEVLVELDPVSAAATHGASVVAGWVTDVATGDPLEGVRILAADAGFSALSGPGGGFVIRELQQGPLRLVLSRLGYADRELRLEVDEGQRVELRVTMGIEPIELDPIEVSVEARSLRLEISGFYDRRSLSLGQFLSLDQIEKRAVSKTTDLFNDFRGIRFITHDGAGREEAVAFQRGQVVKSVIEARRICYPAVWIDDIKVAAGGGDPAVLNRYVTPRDIAGIEVYTSTAQIPSRYSGTGSACGAILVWTRG